MKTYKWDITGWMVWIVTIIAIFASDSPWDQGGIAAIGGAVGIICFFVGTIAHYGERG